MIYLRDSESDRTRRSVKVKHVLWLAFLFLATFAPSGHLLYTEHQKQVKKELDRDEKRHRISQIAALSNIRQDYPRNNKRKPMVKITRGTTGQADPYVTPTSCGGLDEPWFINGHPLQAPGPGYDHTYADSYPDWNLTRTGSVTVPLDAKIGKYWCQYQGFTGDREECAPYDPEDPNTPGYTMNWYEFEVVCVEVDDLTATRIDVPPT